LQVPSAGALAMSPAHLLVKTLILQVPSFAGAAGGPSASFIDGLAVESSSAGAAVGSSVATLLLGVVGSSVATKVSLADTAAEGLSVVAVLGTSVLGMPETSVLGMPETGTGVGASEAPPAVVSSGKNWDWAPSIKKATSRVNEIISFMMLQGGRANKGSTSVFGRG
jgi:hypothetical protein